MYHNNVVIVKASLPKVNSCNSYYTVTEKDPWSKWATIVQSPQRTVAIVLHTIVFLKRIKPLPFLKWIHIYNAYVENCTESLMTPDFHHINEVCRPTVLWNCVNRSWAGCSHLHMCNMVITGDRDELTVAQRICLGKSPFPPHSSFLSIKHIIYFMK